jgi:cell division protein FtsX
MGFLIGLASNVIANLVFWVLLGAVFWVVSTAVARRFSQFFGLRRVGGYSRPSARAGGHPGTGPAGCGRR